eukprot:CAMPEP_0176471754 /NCGR_PEP_ID=MMETSP0127-20121128/41329_1 /TAXON_ID=938130 /ORGANISM="Platyophrya macrostoma, Strain WH" /LENGTH=166 /DNA_ID=CAMNT_0017866479 /DNA_START=42 /DNA_END=539 /DNA_ORIENTATION=-
MLLKKTTSLKKIPTGLHSILLNYFSSFKSFKDFEKFRDHLDNTQPSLSCLLFTASWNPMSDVALKNYENIVSKHPGYEFVHLDLDGQEKAKRYFGVKCEPEFVICALGCEIIRHTGIDFAPLNKKLEKVADFYARNDLVPGTEKYEKFQEKFLAEYEIYEKEFDYW